MRKLTACSMPTTLCSINCSARLIPIFFLHTQFYSGHLNLMSLIDLRTLTFLNDFHFYDVSCPASHLFYICGTPEWIELANRYNINFNDSVGHCKAKIWALMARPSWISHRPIIILFLAVRLVSLTN